MFELNAQTNQTIGSWESLISNTQNIGKPEWRPMLKYVAELHKKSTHPAQYPFPYEWEEIGPGYIYGPAFGHWDIVHQSLDVVASFPEHSIHQLLNDIAAQEQSGLIPGMIQCRVLNGRLMEKQPGIHLLKVTRLFGFLV